MLSWHSAALYRTYRCTRICLFFPKRRGDNRRDGRLPEDEPVSDEARAALHELGRRGVLETVRGAFGRIGCQVCIS